MSELRVLTVCTHNQTRSVLVAGLLARHLDRLGVDGSIRGAGFAEPGHRPTSPTVRHLHQLGIDVARHRSRRISAADVAEADLILTAERMHVVEIAGRWPEAFAKTLTLPEIVSRASDMASRGDQPCPRDLASWLERLGDGRPRDLDYLEADDVGEIADPTGGAPAGWRACFAQIDDLTGQLAAILAAGPMKAP